MAAVVLLACACGGDEPCELDLVPFDELPLREELPDPLLTACGEQVVDATTWESVRRPEILSLFRHYMYGYDPAAPDEVTAVVTDTATEFLNGKATRKLVDLSYGPPGAPVLHLLLVVPNQRTGPAPLFLGANFFGNHTVTDDPDIPLTDVWVPDRAEGQVDNRATEASRGTASERWAIEQSIDRGYAVATFYHGDLDPDFDDDQNGIQPFYRDDPQAPRGREEWATIAAWAWGLVRAVDYLVTDPDVDSQRIAVMGHSRNGKAALWAGALDPRIALVVSNQSGCSGAALSRRGVGESLYVMNRVNPHWFSLAYHDFGGYELYLPFDQHFLLALIAPRPVLVASAEDDAWADPEGEFLAAVAADPVFRLLDDSGIAVDTMPPTGQLIDSRIGYHIRPGDHGVSAEDWTVFLDFADTQLGAGR